MNKVHLFRRVAVCLSWAYCFVTLAGQIGNAQGSSKMLGGARGVVRSAAGAPLEGVMVQLVSQQNSIRTTVYSSADGTYEFPKLPLGLYTLRIARPLEFRPYQRDTVRIEGTTRLPDIILERVTVSELLPPTPEIAAQLSGAEWLLNLPGTGEEKRALIHTCGFTCHSFQQIFRARFDEAGWRLVVQRMTRGQGSTLINVSPRTPQTPSRSGLPISALEEEALLAKWLARIRGPESKDPPFHVLPGPTGAATRLIVTEYELPRLMIAPHDVAGDSKGGIWYTPHRSPYIGRLDPETGNIKEHRVPSTPGVNPGTHRVAVDHNDVVWLSENWSKKLTRFDQRTEKFTQFQMPQEGSPLNSPGFSNFALDPKGYIWHDSGRQIVKISPKTGEYLERYPFRKITGTYDNMISADGRFWSGGQWPGNLIGLFDIEKGELQEIETRSVLSSPSRGGFDPEGNAWFGGRGGTLIKLDIKTRQTSEYSPPIPYVNFYEAMPDKNGEVWAGLQHGGRFIRFNPRTERWIVYVLPEPYAHNRRTWIDNSTDPVTVWYVDHNGYMVRIQPME